MIVKKLCLQNFLSYKEQDIIFGKGLNVVKGKNASGKTNLLESIYLSAIGKTARNTKDKDLLNWENNGSARVTIQVAKKYGDHKIEITINSFGQKFIQIDEIPISKMGELMGAINIVFFSPDEMKLIKDSPVDRRRFLDISLSQQSKTYFYTLMKYNKLLQQRNKLLKEHKNKASLNDMLDIVHQSLLPCVEYIVTRRKDFVEKLQPFANGQHQKITNGVEQLDISYETDKLDFDDIKKSMNQLYINNLEKDKRLEYTSVGPHRDDLKIVAGGIDVRKYGSQGQQRTAVLSLKLAEIMMLEKSTGEYPILLLDDVLSELDVSRQKALLESVKDIQTIITCTEFESELVKYDYHEIHIKDKKIFKTERITNVQ